MLKFILKSISYFFLILIALELLVRIFHLYTEDPPRYIDKQGVEKRVPNHTGYAVTGNRNQNVSQFRINDFGFNSKWEFEPSDDNVEIAIIGDSFIEGFHQDYDRSTGTMLEEKLEFKAQVYEFGYAGYDLADQMHLLDAYKDKFSKIDRIVIYLNYESDLQRGVYEPNVGRIQLLSSTLFKIRDNIKLLAYGAKIGILEPVKNLLTDAPKQQNNSSPVDEEVQKAIRLDAENANLQNFKELVGTYGFDREKTVLLLDSRKTADSFLIYCDANGIGYIDFAQAFEKAGDPTTLIYDHHWNTYGRELVAEVLAKHFNTEK